MIVEVDGLTLRLNGPINGRQSSIAQYMDCHRLHGWQRVEGLEPDKPSWALEFGSATHKFLQEVGRGIPRDDAMRMGIERMLVNIPKPQFPGEEEEIFKFKELARTLWPMHQAYWGDETDQFIPFGQEVKGRVEVGSGTNVFLVFTTDWLGKWGDNLWIKDYKTMGKNDDREFRKYEMDMQVTAYIYGASCVLNTRVAGVIIDGLIKTKVPQFRREHYIRTDEELLEFEAEFVEVMKELAWRHARVATGEPWKTVFYKNTKQCFRYYTCPFLELCNKDTPMNRMAFRPRPKDYMDDPKLLEVKK